MPDSSIDALVQRLRQGDSAAAAELVKAYEPLLRMVIRRQLSVTQQSKFDSVDIVQSIWMDVLAGFNRSQWEFENSAQLQAFLIKVAKNRLIDRARQQRNVLAVSALLADEVASPAIDTPSEELISAELWGQLLELCPPHHHPILELKRQGFKIVEIAERVGMHSGSVRRILYDLSKRIVQQNSSSGNLTEGN